MTIPPNDILQEAIHYAQQGLPVFPCEVDSKAPLTRNGFKDASVNIEHIKCWWANHPTANIGMPTGATSHLIVMDIDPRHGGDHHLGVGGPEHLRGAGRRAPPPGQLLGGCLAHPTNLVAAWLRRRGSIPRRPGP